MQEPSANGQITTFTLFQFSGFANQYWAFSQMGLAPWRLRRTAGLEFYKMLGSGKDGFRVRPNFSLYGLLAVWKDEAAAETFFLKHPVMQDFRRRADTVQTTYLRASVFHGSWDGFSGFQSGAAFRPDAPLAVITRGAIRLRYLPQFWKYVAPASLPLAGQPGLLYAVGVGERPLMALATFSLWTSGKAMLDYAYRDAPHAQAVRRTRELGWFSEELFARFVPYRVEGEGPISNTSIFGVRSSELGVKNF